MDLDEWELLPIDGFLDFGEGCEKKVKAVPGKRRAADSTTTFINVDLDYFRCPPPPPPPASSKLSPPPQPQLVPVRIQLDPPVKEDPGGGSEVKIVAPASEGATADQDPVSQVFFKKLKENEFVDMKILESPRSGSRPMSPPIDNFRFEDKPEIILDGSRSPRRVPERHAGRSEEANGGGMNIWKWSLTGIGALCSFGVAAATICTILIIGSHQKNKQNHQKIKFQIYTDDKRIKQVIHHASKLNEAISAARGVPLTRAQITIGGHYEGL